MDAWHAAHLVSLSLWAGLVAAESIVELSARTDEQYRHAATLHYWMDLLVELPVLAAVLTTGAVLASRALPLSALHWVKVAAGLVAVGANLWCVVHVVARRRRMDDAAMVRRHARWIRVTAGVGVPCAGAALYIGLSYFA